MHSSDSEESVVDIDEGGGEQAHANGLVEDAMAESDDDRGEECIPVLIKFL